MIKSYIHIFIILAVFGLCACASDGNKTNEPVAEQPVEQLYAEAQEALDNQQYRTAANLFDDVERQHPYSDYASKAKLMAAFSHYKALRYDEAILSLDRFIELHPGHSDIAYAYYLRALSYYEQIIDVGRDQAVTRQAMSALEDIIRRFPDSEYARDAALKMDLTRDHLAGKEMEVGRYYLKRNQYQAAIKRFTNVVDNYQTTTHVPEALHRLVECYVALGLTGEATKIAAVLGHNYPGSKWYEASYALMNGKDLPEFNANKTTFQKLKDTIF